MAVESVKTGKLKLQDANDFFEWATKSENSSSVTYKFYSKAKYAATVTSLERKYKEVKAVLNTRKGNHVILYRNNCVNYVTMFSGSYWQCSVIGHQ